METVARAAPISCLHFTHGGNHLAVASAGCVRIYDTTADFTLVWKAEVLPGRVIHCLDSHGRFLACAGEKALAMVHSGATAMELLGDGYSKELSDVVLDVQILEDDNAKVALGFCHNFIEIHSFPSGACIQKVQCSVRGLLYCMAFSGRTESQLVVASGTVTNSVLIWDPVDDGCPAHVLSNRLGCVLFSVTWSHDRRRICCTSDDRTVRVWQVKDVLSSSRAPLSKGDLLKDATEFVESWSSFGHSSRVWDCIFFRDENVISCAEDGIAAVWNAAGECREKLRGHLQKNVWCVAAHSELSIVATGGGDGSVKLWDVTFPHHFPQYFLPSARAATHRGMPAEVVRCICLGKDERSFVATSLGAVYSVDTQLNRWQLLQSSSDKVPISVLALHPSHESLIASGDVRGFCNIFPSGPKFSSQSFSSSWRAHETRCWRLQWLSQNLIVTCCAKGELRLWQLATSENERGEQEQKVILLAQVRDEPGAPVRKKPACFSSFALQGSYLYTGNTRGTIGVWDTTTMDMQSVQILRRMHGKETVRWLGFGPDSCLYSAGSDGRIVQFEVHSDGKQLLPLNIIRTSPVSTPQALAWSPSGGLQCLGFQANEFISIDLETRMELPRTPCGGWKRPFSVVSKITTSGEQELRIAYVPAHTKGGSAQKKGDVQALSACFALRDFMPSQHLKQARRLLGTQFHGRVSTCVKWIQDEELLLTGGERGMMKLFTLGGDGSLKCIQTTNLHASAIRAIGIARHEACPETVALAVGGHHSASVGAFARIRLSYGS